MSATKEGQKYVRYGDLQVALVILVKNEIEPLKAVFPKIDTSVFVDIFCMDGHSDDGSVEFLQSNGVRVIKQKILGRGLAVIESLEHTDADALLFFSPDGNEDPEDLKRLVDTMVEFQADLVIASRFAKGATSDDSDDPYKIRRVGNLFYSKLVDLIWGGKITDTINGYRLIRKATLEQLNQDASGYNIEIQQTIRCLKLKKRIVEIPTTEMKRIGFDKQSPTIKMGFQFTKMLIRELVIGTKFLRPV